jgi:hypothetical protein
VPEVATLVPAGTRSAASLVHGLGQLRLEPFRQEFIQFAADLAKALRGPTLRSQPAVAALAYWIRPASINRLRDEWQVVAVGRDHLRVPRGVVFHLPPTNVDTLFVYSWLLSAAVGNANIIRISPSAVAAATPLLDTIASVLDRHPSMADTTAFVTYAHDPDITAALSRGNMRVIWGGDHAVREVRAVPLAPHAIEIAFADRFSLAALDASHVASLAEAQLSELAHNFFNDCYWFDQLGCASPRAVVWIGSDRDIDRAAQRFWPAVTEELDRRRQVVGASAAITKLVHAATLAVDGALTSVDWSDNRLTVADGVLESGFDRVAPGAGWFLQYRVRSLVQIATLLEPRDQTLSYFGIEADELRSLAASCRGLDRLVPVGSALAFGRYWDGHDLLAAFSRLVHVQEPASAMPHSAQWAANADTSEQLQ